jgi:hypothetical protein
MFLGVRVHALMHELACNEVNESLCTRDQADEKIHFTEDVSQRASLAV